MATTAVSLHLRTTKTRSVRNPNLLHFFSTSSIPKPDNQNAAASPPPPPPQPQSSFSSYFNDVMASVKQKRPPPPAAKAASLEEIRKNLEKYRRGSATPPPPSSSSSFPPSQPVSFQELYQRNVISRGEEQQQCQQSSDSAKLSFDRIRDSLNRIRSNNQPEGAGNRPTERLSLQRSQDSLRIWPADRTGRTELLAALRGSGERSSQAESAAARIEFVKSYSYDELGAKLRKLRPEASKGGKKERFSLVELNERLIKLREMEEQEYESSTAGKMFRDLRNRLVQIRLSERKEMGKSSGSRDPRCGMFGQW